MKRNAEDGENAEEDGEKEMGAGFFRDCLCDLGVVCVLLQYYSWARRPRSLSYINCVSTRSL